MDQENIMFSKKNNDKSYTMTGLYLNHNLSFGYEDSYNHYDIDVDKILLLKNSHDEYFVRYNDVNKKKIVPLQLKIENFYFDKLHMFTRGVTIIPICSNDDEFSRKCEEIWDKITELIGIDNPTDYVQTALDDDEDELIMVEVEKNTSSIRDKYRNFLVFVFTSVFYNSPQTSLVQYRY